MTRTLLARACQKSAFTRPGRSPISAAALTSRTPGKSLRTAFKLTRVSGAYWRGDQAREQMQRVYGVAFDTQKELDAYFVRLEEAKKRDHRKLGQDLDLFSIQPDTVGGGLILWHPKGGLIRHLAEEYCKKRHLESGYDFVYTPHIGRADPLGNQRASRLLRREHVRADQDRRAALLPEADELPVPRQYL